jgi:aryl-alcohol dehydrogenase-like predicted oxidoreductase
MTPPESDGKRDADQRPTRQNELRPSLALEGLGLRGDRVGFGLAGIGGAWGPVDQGLARETLRMSLELGMRVFDAAPSYGTAETLLGEALRAWRGERLVISTKVGRLPARDGHEIIFNFASEAMRASLERSLATIGVPRVDILFLHEPDYVPVAERPRVVAALRQMQTDGLTVRLGLAGGFGSGWDGYVESGAFDVVMLFRRLDASTLVGLAHDVPRVRRAGLATYGASPLHMGLLGSRYDEFVRDRKDWVGYAATDRAIRLRAVAEKHGMSLAMLSHRFVLSVTEIDRMAIGARSPEELTDACDAWRAGPLPAELYDAVCNA